MDQYESSSKKRQLSTSSLNLTKKVGDQGPSIENVIKSTRKMIKGMTQQQRFRKALHHVQDALLYRNPRPDIFSPNQSQSYETIYQLQTSKYWQWVLFLCSWAFIYLIIFSDKSYFVGQVTCQFIILAIFWIDTGLFLYHKSFEKIKIKSNLQVRFYIKIFIIILLTVDLIIYLNTYDHIERPIRPFRILRGLLPIFYDSLTRKNFHALIAAYKDIISYAIIFACFILTFTLITNQVVRIPADMVPDQLTNNYPQFIKAIYVIYTLSSYDAYPDNQLISLKQNLWTYAIFIIFILLNVFFFSVIPSSIILDSFQQTRSKTLLIDQIKQQHSLILAFVSIGQQNYYVDINTLIRFLIYMYKHKVRYVNYITQICLKLDNNQNGFIQVRQFMEIGKILSKNSQMLPPEFDDWKSWLKFREFFIENVGLDKIVNSWGYKIISNVIVILTFINSIAYIVTQNKILHVIDDILIWFFVADMILRIVGIGPEEFFLDKWNKLDFALVVIILIVELFPDHFLPFNADVLLKMTRAFRVTTTIKLVRMKLFFKKDKKQQSQTQAEDQQDTIYYKTRKLYGQTTVIIPIILKFFPFFLISCYFLGVLGMQIFYEADKVSDANKYNAYRQFSNFSYFLGTQFILIQVLTQAGWSLICFDYVKRTGFYFPVALFFMILHLYIVLVLATLFKGIIWQAYKTVQQQWSQKEDKIASYQIKQQRMLKKKIQFDQIRAIIEQSGYIQPNSVIKREFLQNKLDIQIFKSLKELAEKSPKKKDKKVRSSIIQQIFKDKKQFILDQLTQKSSLEDSQAEINFFIGKLCKQIIYKEQDLEAIQQQDFDDEMEQLMQKLILHPKIKYSQTIVYPKFIIELLQTKMIKPLKQKAPQKGFNINKNPFLNKDGIEFHTYQMNVLLQIQRSQRQQKLQIIKTMIDNQLITEEEAKQLFSKRYSKQNDNVDFNWIIRKMFLSSTNQQLIKKFEIQYFSDLYGQSFKDINKVTIEPLLRYEALLTYNLRNILRYPQIANNDFFQMLTKIQDSISNQLLKKGSLFKLVYQIQDLADNWFTIQYKDTDYIKVHFIKTGIWIYNKNLVEEEIYYARDLFKWDTKKRQDRLNCQKILKLLFQTFEGLAFGLMNQNQFFRSNPVHDIYDLYTFYLDVSSIGRLVQRKLGISKIMLVILSKQEQRIQDQKLEYELSEVIGQKKPKMNADFKFDDSEKQTFNKLKNLSVLDQDKIIESEGLPFAYVLNMMQEIRDTLSYHSLSIVNHVEKILNIEFQNQ